MALLQKRPIILRSLLIAVNALNTMRDQYIQSLEYIALNTKQKMGAILIDLQIGAYF